MKNILSLHEAIIIAIININKETYTANFQEIADYIEQNQLFPDRKGSIPLAKQIELRSTKYRGNYFYLFSQVKEDTIQLRLQAKSKTLPKPKN